MRWVGPKGGGNSELSGNQLPGNPWRCRENKTEQGGGESSGKDHLLVPPVPDFSLNAASFLSLMSSPFLCCFEITRKGVGEEGSGVCQVVGARRPPAVSLEGTSWVEN